MYVTLGSIHRCKWQLLKLIYFSCISELNGPNPTLGLDFETSQNVVGLSGSLLWSSKELAQCESDHWLLKQTELVQCSVRLAVERFSFQQNSQHIQKVVTVQTWPL